MIRSALAGASADELAELLGGLDPRKVRAAVKKRRLTNDAYYTKPELAARIWRWLNLNVDGLDVLEPSVGGGAFAFQAELGGARLTVLDVDPEAPGLRMFDGQVADFLTWATDQRFDLILGNPPYTDAEAHIRKAMGLLKPGGRLMFLLRFTILGSKDRARGLYLEFPLERGALIVPRPSFTNDGNTDSAEYVALVWHYEPERGTARGPVPFECRHLFWDSADLEVADVVA